MQPRLKIGFWVINGLSEDMMPEEAFKREINKYDILFLCKTWLRRENINNVSHPNDYLSNFIFRNKMRKNGRPAGAG